MSKQETLDTYWFEFLDFWNSVREKAKEEEKEVGDNLSDVFGFFLDANPEQLKRHAVYQMFEEPTEINFWRWYVLVKKKEAAK